jgi:hypothetical protein
MGSIEEDSHRNGAGIGSTSVRPLGVSTQKRLSQWSGDNGPVDSVSAKENGAESRRMRPRADTAKSDYC